MLGFWLVMGLINLVLGVSNLFVYVTGPGDGFNAFAGLFCLSLVGLSLYMMGVLSDD